MRRRGPPRNQGSKHARAAALKAVGVNNDEVLRRIEFARTLRLERKEWAFIRVAMSRAFGISNPMADNYIKQAKRQIHEEGNRRFEEQMDEAVAASRHNIALAHDLRRDAEVRSDKVQALSTAMRGERQLAELEGTLKPQQHQVAGEGGGAIELRVKEEIRGTLDRLRQVLAPEAYRAVLQVIAEPAGPGGTTGVGSPPPK